MKQNIIVRALVQSIIFAAITMLASALAIADTNYSWNSSDRGAKVSALIPGRDIPSLTHDNLFVDWTRQQVERWTNAHPNGLSAQVFQTFSNTAPSDAALTADFPRHISPFAQVRSGNPESFKVKYALSTAPDGSEHYCPFCQSRTFSITYDPNNPYHGTANCCGTELYGREQDFPPGYTLNPTSTVQFFNLDDTSVEVPCTVYRDKDGVEWNLFIKTLFDHRRWLQTGCDLVKQYGQNFYNTADPLYAYKIAVILDQVADTYYGLPLSCLNQLANGPTGQPLTRAEWEASPRPAIFELGPLGPWNRRIPMVESRGWINMFDEQIWVEPFARVRNHPAFKYYSQMKYGDPEALDRKIMTKVMRELCMIFKSCFAQKLLTNYQEANYVDMWLLGILAQDQTLISFAGPTTEVVMYNHSYQDGLNGEGAPNYMAMPGGYFYPYLRDPKGWLQFYPNFLEEHPFYFAADAEMRKLTTVRGMQVEFGDQHEYAFWPAIYKGFFDNLVKISENEKIGSRNWAGYGVGIMRLGGPGHRQELCLDYTRATLHNAQDALSLECWVNGVPVLRKGGYACPNQHPAVLQWERPEFQALKNMGYPKEIADATTGTVMWAWNYAHSPLCQNNVTIDEVGTGAGWGDNRGYGEVITFKGGEAAGAPGSEFQVLDVRDHYSWARMNKKIDDFRRTLIGVEGPDGRPYVIDLVKVKGEGRQALYSGAWADPVEEQLPSVKSTADNLAKLYYGTNIPPNTVENQAAGYVRNVQLLNEPGQPWSVTWKTDVGSYAPRDTNGYFQQPWPDNTGQVRLRYIGVSTGKTELIRGKGPWISWLRQPLPGGQSVDGYVAFMDAWDFLIERRLPAPGQTNINSLYIHILEGYCEGEQSVINSVTQLEATSLMGVERDIVALELKMADGYTDTVIYQGEAGAVQLPGGIETDARYALLRKDGAGKVLALKMVRGNYLKSGTFTVAATNDFSGTLVDVIGDLTGTRQESALIINPDKPWPAGAGLKDRQLLIRFESELRDAGNEGYRVEKMTPMDGGLIRVDMQDHAPFITSWHEVTDLPTNKLNTIRTWRPMADHANNPWYNGLKMWFPERNKLYTIKKVNALGGGSGGDTVELVENVNLVAEGITVGDWYVIYGIQPGLRVNVAGDGMLTVKADQTITSFPNPGDQITTHKVGLWAQASSGLYVTNFMVISGPGVITGLTNLTFTASGSVSVTADQSGDNDWNAAPAVMNTFNITKATASVTLNNLTQTYNGSARVVTATTVPSGLTVSITYDGNSWAPTNLGTHAVAGVVNNVLYQGAQNGILTIVGFPAPTASKGAYADKVLVYWDVISSAISYKVWRGTNSNMQMASVIGTGTGSFYLDTSPTPDVLYYYWIQAVYAAGTSELSVPDSGYCGTIVNLTGPAGVQASKGSTDRIRISWQAVSDATHYEVWRNKENNRSAASLISEPTGTNYDDYPFSQGICYYYWLKARTTHRDGNFSTSDAGWRLLNTPSGVSVSNGSYPYHIRVVWNAVANAAWYEVWREEVPGINSDGVNLSKVTQTDGVYFNDYYSKSGVYYRYKVKACNELCSSLDYGQNTGHRQVNASPTSLSAINDYDGDKLSDLALFNPLSGVLDVLCSALGRQTFVLGAEHGQGVTGDYDGDRVADPVAYCQGSYTWFAMLSSIGYNPIIRAIFGGNGNSPVAADFDGDGLTDIGVYNATDGVLSVLLSNGGAFDIRVSCLIGGAGYSFVSADFDGDGLADPAVYSESESRVIIFLSGSGYFPISVALGGPGISIYAADFDGDGLADPVLYEEATGIWTVLLSSAAYSEARTLFGGPGYVPSIGDYDGDAKADPAIYRKSDGQWLIMFSAGGYAVIAETFGGGEYQPVAQ